jgi:acetyltransferase-like isoleucine patch superfamily enzyme
MERMNFYLRVVYRKINTLFIKGITFYKCLKAGLPYNKTWRIYGKFYLVTPNRFHKQPSIKIGDNLLLQANLKQNVFGIIQPNYFNLGVGAKLYIGNNVGISGSTISVQNEITIGNDVLIGSGCVISDSDAHPISPLDRNDASKTISKPIIIESEVFIGARSIILKGVIIGRGSVIGAGSVVTKSTPPFSIAAGNPAKVIK